MVASGGKNLGSLPLFSIEHRIRCVRTQLGCECRKRDIPSEKSHSTQIMNTAVCTEVPIDVLLDCKHPRRDSKILGLIDTRYDFFKCTSSQFHCQNWLYL